MNFKYSILVFGLLIIACESREEKALREFGEEMEKYIESEDWIHQKQCDVNCSKPCCSPK